jgi:hypothetical protein
LLTYSSIIKIDNKGDGNIYNDDDEYDSDDKVWFICNSYSADMTVTINIHTGIYFDRADFV